jgi:uncharacterized protein YbjT (DUF2867 family)
MGTIETILVTGATGKQGGAVAHCLLRRGAAVRILTRNRAKGTEWGKAGAEIAVGDLTDRASLDAALRGVKGVFLVTTPFERGMEDEVRQGRTMADAAKAAGAEHLVYTSVGSADRKTGIPHFETKWAVEQHLRKIRIPSTILRPVFFMENFASPWMLPAIQQGTLVFPLPPDRKLQMIALQDIGAFGAAAFLRPKEFIGEVIELAGDALTLPEALEILSRTMGKPIRYAQLPDDQLESALGHDFAVMFRWFIRTGYSADIPALRTRWGIPLTRFQEVIAKASWAREGG